MKKIAVMSFSAIMLASCGSSQDEKPWIVDRFDDVKVIRYEVPGFDELSLEQKELVYYQMRPRHSFRPELCNEPCGAPHAGDRL